MTEELERLAKDLYSQGYHRCKAGISIDKDMWFKAWALAMINVVQGEEYHNDMVIGILYDLQRRAWNEIHD